MLKFIKAYIAAAEEMVYSLPNITPKAPEGEKLTPIKKFRES